MKRASFGIALLFGVGGAFAACTSSQNGGGPDGGGGVDPGASSSGGSSGSGSGSGSSGGSGGGSSGGSGGGSSGGNGGGSSGGGGSGSSSGSNDGGSSGSSCPSPETTFGYAVHGDSNPSFTSGVVARTADSLFIFSYLDGPTPDDGGVEVQAVYAQAFDPSTGNSKGPAQPLFTVPATVQGGDRAVSSAAVAPTGQIALLYYYYPDASGGLWAAFLDSAGGGDSGAAGLQVVHQVELVTPYFDGADPAHVICSNASQSFVISWVGNANAIEASVEKFLPTGEAAGGGDSVVPTDDNGSVQGEPAYVGEGSAGESGNLLGVYYESALASHQPALTMLDSTGNQVGQPVYLAGGTSNGGWGTLAGTAQGFVSVFNPPQATGTSVVFVPVADGGVVTSDAGAFPTLAFPGTAAGEGRAISDSVGPGARGGVGVALFESSSSVTFAYVTADGATYEGPVAPFAATNINGYSLSTFGGSFIVGAFNDQTGSTTAAATGCP